MAQCVPHIEKRGFQVFLEDVFPNKAVTVPQWPSSCSSPEATAADPWNGQSVDVHLACATEQRNCSDSQRSNYYQNHDLKAKSFQRHRFDYLGATFQRDKLNSRDFVATRTEIMFRVGCFPDNRRELWGQMTSPYWLVEGRDLSSTTHGYSNILPYYRNY